MTIQTVNVLVPGGRNYQMKIDSNSSVLQVLEDICTKVGLPHDEYNLKHLNRILDGSNSLRNSNVLNNAHLELVKSSKANVERPIHLAVQTTNGERLFGDFSPGTTLLEAIHAIEQANDQNLLNQNDSNVVPFCLYMRHEVVGVEAMGNTTLRSLGLTTGSALLRLLYKPATVPDNQEGMKSHVQPTPVKPITPPQQSAENLNPFIPSQVDFDPVEMTSSNTSGSNVARVSSSQRSRKSTDDEDEQMDTEREQKRSKLCCNSVCLKSSDSDVDPNSQVSIAAPVSSQSVQLGDVDMEVYVKPGLIADEQNVEVEVTKDGLIYLDERRTILYDRNAIQGLPIEDLPEEFFELTIDDVKRLQADYVRQRQMVENQPLMTKAMRESLSIQSKLAKYTKAMIRIQFPDGLVLQGQFDPTEKVSDVYEWLRKYLVPQAKKFYLYTSPPVKRLVENKTLLEADLVPTGVVRFGILDGSDYSGDFILREIRMKQSNPLVALNHRDSNFIRKKTAERPFTAPAQLAHRTVNISTEDISNDNPVQIQRSNAPLPKWFKMGK